MKMVVQKVLNSSVTIDGVVNGSVDHGFMVLVGFTHEDTKEIVDKMVDKYMS